MTESVFYNLASAEGDRRVGRLRELGHRVGLHAVYPHADSTTRFDPVLAWHNPDPEYMSAPVDGVGERDGGAFFSPATYRSDSNQHWRHGCPHEELGRGELRVAPAARPTPRSGPTRARRCARRCSRCSTRSGTGAWSSSQRTGSTCREADDDPRHRLGRAGHRGAAARAARERRAAGAPGRNGHVRAAVGAHLCDAFYLVPAGSDPGFADAMLDDLPSTSASTRCCRSPRSTCPGSPRRATTSRARCSSPSPDAIRRANDKAESYELLTGSACRRPSSGACRAPRRSRPRRASSATRTRTSASSRSSPRARAGSACSRPRPTGREQLLTNRPGVAEPLRLEEARRAAPGRGRPGAARDGARDAAASGRSTGSRAGGRIALGHPKTREAMRAGLAMYFETLDDPGLMEVAGADHRGARARPLLQHPARRRQGDRDQPADLDDRLPGRPEHPVARRQARARRGRRPRSSARFAAASGRAGCAAVLRPGRMGRLMLRWDDVQDVARSGSPARTTVSCANARPRRPRPPRADEDLPHLECEQVLAAAEIVALGGGRRAGRAPARGARLHRARTACPTSRSSRMPSARSSGSRHAEGRARRVARRPRGAARRAPVRVNRRLSGSEPRSSVPAPGSRSGQRRVPAARAEISGSEPSKLRVVHCPVNTAGVPWKNVQALRRKGVDAKLVVFERYKLHPEADWSLDRHGGFARRQLTQWRALARAAPADRRLPLLLRADARPEVAPVPDPARDRAEVGRATGWARTSAARRRPSSRWAGRAGAQIVGSYDALALGAGGRGRAARGRPRAVPGAAAGAPTSGP